MATIRGCRRPPTSSGSLGAPALAGGQHGCARECRLCAAKLASAAVAAQVQQREDGFGPLGRLTARMATFGGCRRPPTSGTPRLLLAVGGRRQPLIVAIRAVSRPKGPKPSSLCCTCAATAADANFAARRRHSLAHPCCPSAGAGTPRLPLEVGGRRQPPIVAIRAVSRPKGPKPSSLCYTCTAEANGEILAPDSTPACTHAAHRRPPGPASAVGVEG